jgi:hypothetical protein
MRAALQVCTHRAAIRRAAATAAATAAGFDKMEHIAHGH